MYQENPKKSLGQHWLRDQAALQAMVTAAGVQAGDTVLEIGPGLGTLTAELLDAGSHVVAVEFDRDLATKLQFSKDGPLKDTGVGGLQVVNQDILAFDLGTLPEGYKVAANIPYYLTSKLLRVLCESTNPFSQAALLVQKVVAERVAAGPGGMSLLSVSVQFYCDVSLGRVVPAALFEPPPKVDSQILKLTYRTQPLFPGTDTKLFFRLVKAGFSSRRKKLRSSLSGGLRVSKPEAETMLQAAGLDPNLRPQNLSLADWHKLYLAYQKTV